MIDKIVTISVLMRTKRRQVRMTVLTKNSKPKEFELMNNIISMKSSRPKELETIRISGKVI